jgi:hypothetical protein
MAESVHHALPKLLSQLVARDVTFTLVLHPPPPKTGMMYGVYSVLPAEQPLIVKAELPLLARLGGALLGLPEDTAIERTLATPMDESLRDAIHEVLNVSSACLSTEHRVVFDFMTPDPMYCEGAASDLLQSPGLTNSFQVSVQNSTPGIFTILSTI